MGYLTTVTVYNDGLHLLKQHPEDFCNKLYDASLDHKQKDFGVGSFVNFANVQKTRHADDHTIYVHMGNTVTEVNAFSPAFKELINKNQGFAEALVGFLAAEVKDLQRLIKKHKAL